MMYTGRYANLERKLEETRRSTLAFCRFFMPDHFRHPFTKAHEMMAEVLDDDTIRKVNIVGCRGMGKTSIAVKGYIGRKVAWRQAHHLVYGSKNADVAIEKTENLKLEFMRNPRLLSVFGDIRVSTYEDDYGQKFQQKAWVAFGEVCVRGLGLKQPYRGLNYDKWRPDVVFIDDSQDKKEIHNEDIRQEQFLHMRGDIEFCVDQWNDSWWKIIHSDTCKHHDGMTERLDGLHDWTTIRIPAAAYDNEKKVYITLYPDMISQARMDEMVETAREAGTIDVLAREVLARPSAEEAQTFHADYFQEYSEFDRDFQLRLPRMETIVIVDPAKTANAQSDDTAIEAWAIDRFAPAFYLRECISEKMDVDEIQDTAFAMADRFGAYVIGYETDGLGMWGKYPFETQARLLNKQYNIVELKSRKGTDEKAKTARVRLLHPYYKRRQVFHNPRAKHIHRYQQLLLAFPTPPEWHLIDLAGYLNQILSEWDAFFLPPHTGEESDDELEKEMLEMERRLGVDPEACLVREWGDC